MKKRTKKFNDGGFNEDAYDPNSTRAPSYAGTTKTPVDWRTASGSPMTPNSAGIDNTPSVYSGKGSERKPVWPTRNETGHPADHAAVIDQHMEAVNLPEGKDRDFALKHSVSALKESANAAVRNDQWYKDREFKNKQEARAQKTKPREAKYAKGGSASSRADGCAVKGKTKGRMV